MSDGTRTRDHLDHNQELYQLSYAHQDVQECTAAFGPTADRPQQGAGSANAPARHGRVDQRSRSPWCG